MKGVLFYSKITHTQCSKPEAGFASMRGLPKLIVMTTHEPTTAYFVNPASAVSACCISSGSYF